ncbi:hypothetical protein [Paucibacter soli]|uniref:hypothetical protein n=1 Tax=Paucibacter soli TaxID=3133433 RepID=UPI0030B2C473
MAMMQAPARWSEPGAAAWLVPGFDPYACWSICTGFSGHAALADGKGLLPLLVKRRPDAAWASLDRFGIFSHTPEPNSQFACLWVPIERVEALSEELGRGIEALEMSLPIAAGPVEERHMRPAATAGQPQHTVAVIDKGGGAFLHANFRHARAGDGAAHTRIAAFWDQGHGNVAGTWQGPDFAAYGRELRAPQIDALLAKREHHSEADLYRKLGHFGTPAEPVPVSDHGSFVLDCAAGLPEPQAYRDSAKPQVADSASAAALVYVSIPDVQAQDGTCGGPAVYILDGLRYAMANSDPTGRLIVNLSVGVQAGPHDGRSLLEQAMDELLTQPGERALNIVIAAGNGARQAFNAGGQLAAGAGTTLYWRSMPGDSTDSFLEFWWPELPEPGESEAGPSLRLRSPDGQESAPVRPGQASLLMRDGRPLAAIFVQARRGEVRARGLIALAPSDGPRGSGMPGRWRVQLVNEGKQALDWLAWVQGDQPTNASGDLMQSRLEDIDDGNALLGGTLNGIATGRHCLVVGASRLVDGQPADYGSRGGDPRWPWRRDVDALASADASGTADGLCAAGVESGGLVRMSGSSVAAPVAARQFFNWMCAQPARAAGHAAIKALLAPAESPPNRKTWVQGADGSTAAPSRRVLALTPDMPLSQWSLARPTTGSTAA